MLNSKLEQLGAYAFRRLAGLLDGLDRPTGLKPIDLSIGEPRHAVPRLVDDVLARHGDGWNRYPPMIGTADWRAAAGAWLRRRYDLPESAFDPEQDLLPAAGTKEALFLLALAIVPRAKERNRPTVLMPNPFYNVYWGAAVMSGARPVLLPATAETGHLPDLDAIPAADLERAALLYLTSPGNPQGVAASLDYWRKAVRLARRHGFTLVADECYAELWDKKPPTGALQGALAEDGTTEGVIVVHSLSKRSSAPGLRSGLVAGDRSVIAAFGRLRAFAAPVLPLPIQAASAALWRDEEHVRINRRLYREKFDRAEADLAGRLGFYRPDAGFFLWLDVGDGETAARDLWRRAAVKSLPGAYLARATEDGINPGARFLRLALVDPLPTVAEALERIGSILR